MNYKLLKDLPTIKAGATFKLDDKRGLVLLKGDRDTYGPFIPGVFVLYDKPVLDICPNILKDWFEEISEQSKTVDELKEGDKCYQIQISVFGPVAVRRHWHKRLEYDRALGLLYATRSECENKIRRMEAEAILKRSTKGYEPDWDDSYERKYYVGYDYVNGKLDILQTSSFRVLGEIYFFSNEDAEASIKTHEKEWKTYFGVEE